MTKNSPKQKNGERVMSLIFVREWYNDKMPTEEQGQQKPDMNHEILIGSGSWLVVFEVIFVLDF